MPPPSHPPTTEYANGIQQHGSNPLDERDKQGSSGLMGPPLRPPPRPASHSGRGRGGGGSSGGAWKDYERVRQTRDKLRHDMEESNLPRGGTEGKGRNWEKLDTQVTDFESTKDDSSKDSNAHDPKKR